MKKYYRGMAITGLIIIITSVVISLHHPQEQTSAEPIKIGTIMSETGVAAAFGTASRQGVELAIEEINLGDGINGHPVELIAENDMTDPKVAAGLYKKLTSINHVDAIIGSNFDFTVQPVFDLAKDGSTVVITPTSSRIPGSLETNTQSFSLLTNFEHIVSALEKYMSTSPYQKIGVIHYTSNFGVQISTTLGGIAKEHNKSLVVDDTYTAFGTTDWKPYILKLKREGVDLVFCDMLADDILRFTKEAKALGYTGQIMTHNDIRNIMHKEGTDTSTLEGVVVLNWDVLGDESFVNKYKARFKMAPMNYASQSYMAVYMIKEALEKDADSRNLARNLENYTFSTPLGSFSFTKEHDAARTPIKVQQIHNNTLIDLYSTN